MRHRTELFLLQFCLIALLGAPGHAQPARQPRQEPPPESVTVTGTRSAEVIQHFIETFAAPTQLLGKMSRWETGTCPVAVGLRPAAIQFILQRLRDRAKDVGAPVNDKPNCRANIEIVFTTTPQGLLDNVRKDHELYLGYASSSSKADKLAIVTHPIQAWYTTASEDILGIPKVDNPRTYLVGDKTDVQIALAMGSVTGLRNRDGRKSTLYHVIIAVDPTKLLDHEIGGMADYISFLALSQPASLDRCQELPSIMNMQVPNCAAITGEMTQNDLAFLRGLYKMPLDGNFGLQKDGIGYEMKRMLQGQ